MPWVKPIVGKGQSIKELLLSKGFTATSLAETLGVSYPTGKKKLDNPLFLTVNDIYTLVGSGHIPIDEFRKALKCGKQKI